MRAQFKIRTQLRQGEIDLYQTKNEMSHRIAYKRALLREVWLLSNGERAEIRALLYLLIIY
ncbi:hypothetical protein [Lysinibacillus xylanilyticus]|uniref:hypothetical protein n=1 Tax=Lysinibacillus xylanilyticus TaxID=582475 RepID=UPI0037F3AC5C